MGRLGGMDERKADNDVGSSSESEAVPEANVFPVIERRYEPAPDLDDRLRRVYALLSLPPLPF